MKLPTIPRRNKKVNQNTNGVLFCTEVANSRVDRAISNSIPDPERKPIRNGIKPSNKPIISAPTIKILRIVERLYSINVINLLSADAPNK